MLHLNTSYVSGGKYVCRETWTHSSRTIDTDLLIYIVSGELFIAENDVRFHLKPKDVLFLKAGEHHFGYQECHPPLSYYWIHFTPIKGDVGFKMLSLKNSSYIDVLCRQLFHCANTPNYPKESMDYITRLILIELAMQNRINEDNNLALIIKIKEWIRVNSDRNLKASDIAGRFGYNEDYLTRIFKAESAQGLKQCIIEAKLQYIESLLLSSNYSLNEISQMSGFDDYKCFLKFFKYHEKMTPSQFRNLYYNVHFNIK